LPQKAIYGSLLDGERQAVYGPYGLELLHQTVDFQYRLHLRILPADGEIEDRPDQVD
jgi:hypothetical protein